MLFTGGEDNKKQLVLAYSNLCSVQAFLLLYFMEIMETSLFGWHTRCTFNYYNKHYFVHLNNSVCCAS